MKDNLYHKRAFADGIMLKILRVRQEIKGVENGVTIEAKVSVKQGRSHEPGNTESF